jgi:ATP-dependent RNA helicase DDX27
VQPRKKSKKGENKSSRQTVADLAYRRAKAAKSTEKLVKAGKIGPQKKYKGKVDGSNKSKVGAPKSRKDEMEEMFQDDRSDVKQRKPGREPGRTKKPTRKPGVSKRSFKSKSRYKRHK